MRCWIRYILVCSLSVWVMVLHAKKAKVGCIGDSVTKGYGIKGKGQSYPEQLQMLLGDGYEVGNFGHSGATLLTKGHNPYIQTQEFRNALVFAPDIVVISLGLNDTDPRNWPNYGTEFMSDYTALIDSFRTINPKVEVYVCKMTPIFSGHKRFLSGTRDWFNEIQDLIPKVASANGAKLIDNYSPLVSRLDLFDDFIHPDMEGAKILATTVHRSLVGAKFPLSLDVTLGSGMVLQRGRPNKVFGNGIAGQQVFVSFEDREYKALVDEQGRWSVLLPSHAAGGPYTINIKSREEVLKLEDVWFGDVYLASGQSNMAFPLRNALGAEQLIKTVTEDLPVRFFKSVNLIETNNIAWDSLTLQRVNDRQFFHGQWQKPTTNSVADFSAIAYAFAIAVSQQQGVAVGIIEVAVGGSNTESWIPTETLKSDNLLATYIHNWRTSDFIQDFCRQRADINVMQSKVLHQAHPYAPGYNFDAGIAPWTGTNLCAVLWYQGESNAHNVELHEHLFTTMVGAWRERFAQELPFYFVQLSSIDRPSWPVFRDSQRKLTTRLNKVYMAVSSDLGDHRDVHPREKILIGQRLAKLAAKHGYGQSVQADSPQPIDVKKRVREVVISFDGCNYLQTRSDETIKDLVLLDKRGMRLDIKNMRVEGSRLYITCDTAAVTEIRYGFKPYTTANLENEAGIPVSTFRININ